MAAIAAVPGLGQGPGPLSPDESSGDFLCFSLFNPVFCLQGPGSQGHYLQHPLP